MAKSFHVNNLSREGSLHQDKPDTSTADNVNTSFVKGKCKSSINTETTIQMKCRRLGVLYEENSETNQETKPRTEQLYWTTAAWWPAHDDR